MAQERTRWHKSAQDGTSFGVGALCRARGPGPDSSSYVDGDILLKGLTGGGSDPRYISTSSFGNIDDSHYLDFWATDEVTRVGSTKMTCSALRRAGGAALVRVSCFRPCALSLCGLAAAALVRVGWCSPCAVRPGTCTRRHKTGNKNKSPYIFIPIFT